MNVTRNLFCSYQAAPQNDFPRDTVSPVSGTNGHYDDRSNRLNEAPILAACRGGNLSWVRELLESAPHLANQTALSGKTGQKVHPLYIAAQEGHIDIVKYLTAVFIETLQTLPEADRGASIGAMVTASCTDQPRSTSLPRTDTARWSIVYLSMALTRKKDGLRAFLGNIKIRR